MGIGWGESEKTTTYVLETEHNQTMRYIDIVIEDAQNRDRWRTIISGKRN